METLQAFTKVAGDWIVIDPKCDTCTKRGVKRTHKKNSTHHTHRQCVLAVWPQINAAKIAGRQSCNVFVSVMLPG
jgi:hypothetical protein